MRNGKDEFYILNYLSTHEFLPNYGFPSTTNHIQMYKVQPPSGERIVHREALFEIREFASHNTIYFMGSNYNVRKAQARRQGIDLDVHRIFICSICNYIEKGSSVDSYQNCPSCQSPIRPVTEIKNCIPFPNM